MPKPADLVGVAKWESAAGGGDALDDVPFPSEAEPEEDAIKIAGIAFGESGKDGSDEIVMLYRELDRLVLADGDNPSGLNLATLAAGGSADFGTLILTSDGGIVYTLDGCPTVKLNP